MPFLTVAGRKTYYAHRRPVPKGSPPVVFIHGAGGTHQHWLYQVRDLPRSVTYAIDLPGHGQSAGPGCTDISAYGDWLVAFLDAAGLDRVVLVGHSMGGGIALDTALRSPSRVAGLGLIATGARLRVTPALFDALNYDPQAAVKLLCDWVFGTEASPELVRQAVRQMAATPVEVFYGDFVACNAFNVMDRLGQIAVPTLVLCGTQDNLTPLKYSVYLRDHIAGATLHLLEGAGHMVMLERPEAVAQALQAFLNTLRPS